MEMFNPQLLYLARKRLEKSANEYSQNKMAAVPPDMAAAGMPVDPMAGAVPPTAGLPPMDPSMAGAVDPAMAGMGAGPLPGAPPAPAPAASGSGSGGGSKKIDPALLDTRLYYIQVQLSAIMNALGLELPPEAIILPPGGMAPPMEAAIGSVSSQNSQASPKSQASAISPISPIQPAMPEAEMGKSGHANPYDSFETNPLMSIFGNTIDSDIYSPPSDQTLFSISKLLKSAREEDETGSTQQAE